MKKEEGMKSIKRLGILSTAYVASIFYAVLGFFQGIAMALQVTNPTLSSNMDPTILASLSSIGWWLVLLLPLVFALIGFLGGILLSVLYNLVARFTGGIKVDLE